MSGVARSERVISIRKANEVDPASAISAGQLTVSADGFSAISTPQKPMMTALQRRQPIFSRSRMPDSAVTKIGQANGGEEEGRHLGGGQRHPQQLQPRTLQAAERGTALPDHRQQQHQRSAGAQPQQLPDRIGPDEEFAERIAKREHEYAEQHQADAGQPRGAFVEGGCFGEEGHA
jgi:flagellum-specific peptidoglycan hydrolase FlgJ